MRGPGGGARNEFGEPSDGAPQAPFNLVCAASNAYGLFSQSCSILVSRYPV